MKQLPHVAAALYGKPWSILPEEHAALGALFRSYVRGELPAMPAAADNVPQGVAGIEHLTCPAP